MTSTKIRILLLLVAASSIFNFQFPISNSACAQDSCRLRLEIENHHFFRNNEYGSNRMDGYTLPGFYMRPKLVWQVEPRLRLSVGAHWLNYWGAHGYPASVTYVSALPEESDDMRPVHILPWVQARVDFLEGVSLILGSVENNEGHQMPRPLYNPELRYAADPEAGAQLLVERPWISADLWANWNEFIFSQSRQQERFYTGASVKVRYSKGPWTFYLPLYGLATHTGGEGLKVRLRTNNKMNFGAGLGASYSDGPFGADLEMLVLGFSQQRDSTIPFESGHGFSPTLRVRYGDAGLLVNYWHGTGYVPLLGHPIYSNTSLNHTTLSVYDNRALTVGVDYTWRHFKACTVVLEADLVNYFPYTIHWKDWVDEDRGSKLMVGFGVHVKLNPTLPLLR